MLGKNVTAPTTKGVHIHVTQNEVFLDATIFNYKVIVDLILFGLAIYLTYRVDDKSFYFIPLCAMYIGLIYMLWIDLKPINAIKIEFIDRTIHIQNKNPLFWIFTPKKQYSLDEIDSFVIRSNESSKADFRRYFIDLKLKKSNTVVLLSFINQDDAKAILNYLTSIVKK